MPALQVTEIVRRMKQGMTRPFLVRAEDEALYVAKGREATRRGLIAEWICAHLGRRMGLPIPQFSLLEVPQELVSALGLEGSALGPGLVFGSRQESGVQEFAMAQIGKPPLALRHQLLAFDWWIENGDRSLSSQGGNPNLLWRALEKSLFVIDHNLALDPAFDEQAFFETHVFRDDADTLFRDLVRKAEMSAWLEEALKDFDAIANGVPASWHWLDGSARTLPLHIDLQAVKSRLMTRAGLDRGSK